MNRKHAPAPPDPLHFFQNLPAGLVGRELWDLFEDVSFWIKDAAGRFVWVNRAFADQVRASRASILGTRDSDWFFNELASVYMEDDATIVAGGPAIVNKPELVMRTEGCVQWCLTSKFPVTDAKGRIVGSCGTSRPMATSEALPADYADLAAIVTYAHAQVATTLTVAALAREARMSVSSLERYVRRHLRITPQALLQRIRMNRARHLLTASTLKVGEIALACGYESFSSFSRAFRQAFGCPPGEFRRTPGRERR